MLLNESELNGHPWITISFLPCCNFEELWSGAIAFPGIMYVAGRLGSYITQGVYTVSGPFHPFGGAVDIVLVEQQDGTFKSSPWNVRFGKFQGVLKAKEKVVSINVNGVDAGFHMYLDRKGEAYFLRVVEEEGVAVADMYPSSSGDEADVKSSIWRQDKSKSYNYDARRMDLDSKIEASGRKTTPRASSQTSKVFGLVFGCTPVEENGFQEEEEEQSIGVRMDSLERAEIAADLLEVRWSTSLATRKKWKNGKRLLDQRKSVCGVDRKSRIKDIGYSESLNTNEELGVQSSELPQVISPTSQGRYMEAFILEETYMETLYGGDIESQTSSSIGTGANNDNKPAMVKVSEILDYALDISHSEEIEVTSGRLADGGTLTDAFSSVNCESIESIRGEFHESVGHADEILFADCLVAGETSGHDEALKELRESIAKVNLGSLAGIAAVEVETDTDILSTNCVDGEATGLGIKSQIGGTETETGLDISDQSRVIEECVLDHHLEEKKNKDSSGQRLNFIKSSCKLGSCCAVFGSITEVQTLDPCTAAYPLGSFHPASYDGSCCSSSTNQLSSLTAENSVLKSKLNTESSENSQEEQILLSGLDHPTHSKSTSCNSMGKVENPQDFMESNEEKVNESASKANGLQSFMDKSIEEGQLNGHQSPVEKSSQFSSAISIQNVSREPDQESPMLRVEPFPTLRSRVSDSSAPDIHHSLSQSLDSTLESSKLVKNSVLLSSDIAVEETQHAAPEHYTFEELKMIFSDPAVEVSLSRHLLYEGMGYEAAGRAFDAEKMDMDKFTFHAPDIIKNERLVVRIGGLYFPWDAALSIASARGSNGKDQILEPKGMIVVDQAGNILGDPQKSTNTRKGTWRFWPFSSRRSVSMQSRSSDLDNASMSPRGVLGDADLPKPEVTRKTVRGKTPSSEQLGSLNLKEGKNVVTFTFSTPMLGKQQVDARIYLWKWNTRIVVSDVDGTITKSDVLGHFMPLVGIDWSHTGVAHLFSAIKENGYQLLFLSARAISQACHTRQFLFNLKQDGKALPDGPVVISPDGLFPSLYREVIRRAPHEFKISCLEEIKALFPRDSNPFYAGFGNRDTDEISYLKVGIPRGKIFTINPRGEIAVNRQVDTKSYTSLHALVHDMFPPASSTEQEDFNSWNFWRLPPPDISGI